MRAFNHLSSVLFFTEIDSNHLKLDLCDGSYSSLRLNDSDIQGSVYQVSYSICNTKYFCIAIPSTGLAWFPSALISLWLVLRCSEEALRCSLLADVLSTFSRWSQDDLKMFSRCSQMFSDVLKCSQIFSWCSQMFSRCDSLWFGLLTARWNLKL